MRRVLLGLAGVLAGCPQSSPKPDVRAAAAAAPGGKDEAPTAVAEVEHEGAPEPKPEEATVAEFHPNDVVLDQEVETLDGGRKKLSDYRGKTLLVVNTASECGFTPQYADLQKLYAKYHDKGLEVLAFPSNDFGSQEPGDAKQIREFVDEEFSVQFPMFAKVHAKGPEISPLYATLSEDTGEGIKGEVQWNFTKFLVAPDGRVVGRFEPPVSPSDPKLVAAVEQALPRG